MANLTWRWSDPLWTAFGIVLLALGPGAQKGTCDLLSPPAAPSNLQVNLLAEGQVQLTWVDNSNNETGFAIWRQSGSGDWVQIGVALPNSTQQTEKDLNPGASYTYKIRAYNDYFASDWSNSVTLNVPPAPNTPTGLQAQVISSTAAQLTWTVDPTSATGTAIFRENSAGVWTRIAVVVPSVTSYLDQGLSPNSSYTYCLRTHNSYFASDWSNQATVTTPDSSAPPVQPPSPIATSSTPLPAGPPVPSSSTSSGPTASAAGSSGSALNASPAALASAQVQSLEQTLLKAFVRGDTNTMAGFYAPNYLHQDGETKTDLEQTLGWYFQNFTVLGARILNQQYSPSTDGTAVTQSIQLEVVELDLSTGEQTTYDPNSIVQWARQGSTWQITTAEDGLIPGL